jgi:hypothetical protein
MDLYPFLCQIIRKEFSFTPLVRLEDLTEGQMKDISIFNSIVFGGKSRILAEKEREKINTVFRNKIENYYVSCWSISPNESFALWKVFTSQTGGIAIKTTVDKFINSIVKPIDIANRAVTYKPSQNKSFAKTINNIEDCIFSKYDFYEYEQEYRFAIIMNHGSKSETMNNNYLNIPLDFTSMIDSIYLSPYMCNSNILFFKETLKLLDIVLFNKTQKSNIKL